MRLQPIVYSLILNVIALIVTGLLAWEFKSPLLILVVILLQTHALQRFEDKLDDEDDDDFPPRPMGFTADIK